MAEVDVSLGTATRMVPDLGLQLVPIPADMLGNVWEICSDWYQTKLPGGRVVDPRGPASGETRISKGGSWRARAGDCRSAVRGIHGWGQSDEVGFRITLGPVL